MKLRKKRLTDAKTATIQIQRSVSDCCFSMINFTNRNITIMLNTIKWTKNDIIDLEIC